MEITEKVVWERKAVLKLIDLWKEKEIIFNPHHRSYYNRNERYQALSDIAYNLEDMCPEITIVDVKNKINYLRGQYTRELTKLKEGNTKSALFWFNKLHFLKEFVTTRKSRSNCSRSKINPLDVEESLNGEIFEETPSSPAFSAEKSPSTQDNSVMDEVVVLSAPKKMKENSIKPVCKVHVYCEFIKTQLEAITDEEIMDDTLESITKTVFEAKRQQRKKNRRQSMCSPCESFS